MARRNKTFAKHGHLQQPSSGVVAALPRSAETDHLDKVASVDRGRFVIEQRSKLARYDGVVQLGLQLRDEFIDSGMNRAGQSLDTAKLAMAADTIEQLGSLVGELRSAHNQGVKVAAALAGAVKLAQDGLIDISDIFDSARESLLDGTVKVSSIDEVFASDPGELVHGGDDSRHPLPGKQASSGDSLTAYLRSARGR